MIHRYIATFVYTARVPIYAEDEYEAEDMADEVPEIGRASCRERV